MTPETHPDDQLLDALGIVSDQIDGATEDELRVFMDFFGVGFPGGERAAEILGGES